MLRAASLKYEQIQAELQRVKNKYEDITKKHSIKTEQVERVEKAQKDKSSQAVASQKAVKIDKNDPALYNFLEYRLKCNFGDSGEQIEFGMQHQLQIRLFRSTYYYIERHILQKRLAKLSDQDGHLIIACSNCNSKMATL